MATATRYLHDRIAVVFDFDLTLAVGTFDALLRRCGQDPDNWKAENVNPLQQQGWEEVLAKVFALIELSGESDASITRELLKEVGRGLELFDGVPDLFGRLRQAAEQVRPGLELEFYVVSSGLADIISHTTIATEFKAIWATQLHFDDEDRVCFPKLIVTHPEKVRYILALCKGLDAAGPNAPSEVYSELPDEQWHTSLDQVVYVGDGSSDMSVFQFLNSRGGIALAVYKGQESDDWQSAGRMSPDRRVENLASADYRSGGELMQSLCLAVESIAHKVALRALAQGD
ncbi:HAD family hydrolase [Devosia sp. RR2S18]|uniref:HAD family hydrolase n=1 Tax=Devosia rhizosphaerae TaxID=3049774 RepID=UPI0025410F02|nr:haloacid dehalogenase-like hydrolase [Devosia sp. RR2S18]WIJ24977.1 haloacid dehalogenase-like hydrolase [Devosia sp. RR2S18]